MGGGQQILRSDSFKGVPLEIASKCCTDWIGVGVGIDLVLG